MKSKIISVVLCLGVILALALVPGAPAPKVVSANGVNEWGFEMQPNVTKVGFNEDFTVNVAVVHYAGAADAWKFYVPFNTSLLEVTNIVEISPLPTGYPPDPVSGFPKWNNTAGWLQHQSGIAGGDPNVTSTFVSCTVTFRTKAVAGTAYLNFTTIDTPRKTTVILVGSDVLNWTQVVNGTVMIGCNLTVNVTPAGKGTVKANGVTLTSYPNTTTRSWDDVVNLEAVNSTDGWGFVNWTGDLTGSTNPTTVTMNATAKNVTANFEEQPPAISPVPTSLTFNANVGGANPANQTLDICNGGGYTLNWTANITGVNATLFSMSPMNGTNLTAAQCNSTEVAVNITGLTEGTYYANITITGNSSVEVPVTLNLGVPEISASPTPLTFTTNEGEDPPDQTLEICNSGTGTLNWSLTDNAGWLSESPTSGSLGEGECEDVTVSVDVSGMAAGDYTATITITGSPTVSVPVNLHILSALPEMPVGPAQLSASALDIMPQQVQPGQDVTISINVANTGGETGSYNAVLYINGVVEDSQSVSVAGGTSKNVIFTVSKTKAGVYDVSVAGQNGQFEVVSTSWFAGGLGTGGIIAIVVIVIVLIAALVFILRGTTRPE